MDFKNDILKMRNGLSQGSLKTYNSLLKSMYKSIWPSSVDKPDIKNFDKVDDVLKFLKDKSPSSRKTYLSALVVMTDNNDYKKMMNEDMAEYKKQVDTNIKNEKQELNDISTDEIKEVLNKLKKEADLIYKKEKLNMNDLQKIQDFIILCLVSPVMNIPRRALDYTLMKFRGDIDEKKDNFLDMKNNKLIFNVFKTSKYHHQQFLNINNELKVILRKWIKNIPDGINHVLFNSKNQPLSSITLNQRLHKIFKGRKISVNQMRHTFMSDKYADVVKAEKEMGDDLNKMGSSLLQKNVYVKL